MSEDDKKQGEEKDKKEQKNHLRRSGFWYKGCIRSGKQRFVLERVKYDN